MKTRKARQKKILYYAPNFVKERNEEKGEEMAMTLNNKKQNKKPHRPLKLYEQKTMTSVSGAKT